MIAYLLTNVGYDRLHTSHPKPFTMFDNHPAVDLIYEKQREAEYRAHETEEKWKNEAATERFLAKLRNLENQKETYQNIQKIREWKLKEIESKGRDAQLNEFLGRFKVKDVKIKGIDPGIQNSLHIFGLNTAADLTALRIDRTWGVGTPHGEKLLDWRKKLERQFIFDHTKAVPTQSRVKVEREIDHLRLQLESELRNGALNRHHLKKEIEENRKELFPALADARHLLAPATSEMNLIRKRNGIIPAIITLLIALFIGLSISIRMGGGGYMEKEDGSTLSGSRSPALNLFMEGVKLKQEGNYRAAVVKLEQAIKLDPHMVPAFEALGFSLHKLKDYQGAIRTLNMAVQLGSKNFDTYYGLGMVYIDKKDWFAAEDSFKSALARRDKVSGWTDEFTEAHYRLGQSIVEGGGDASEIAALENSLKFNDIAEDRFRLAILNLWLGKDIKVESALKQLDEVNSRLAIELKKLMDRHKGVVKPVLSHTKTLSASLRTNITPRRKHADNQPLVLPSVNN